MTSEHVRCGSESSGVRAHLLQPVSAATAAGPKYHDADAQSCEALGGVGERLVLPDHERSRMLREERT